MAKKIKRIKESVTIVEYEKLKVFISESVSIRENSKLNLLRAFTILFYTGLRLNFKSSRHKRAFVNWYC